MLMFKKAVSKIMAEEEIKPGAGIVTSSSSGSLGYRARMNGQNGMVTCGHVAKTIGAKVYKDFDIPYPSGDLIGSCLKTQISGSVDAAFIKMDSPYEPSNMTWWGTMLSPWVSYPLVGMSVNKEGKAGRFSIGKVVAIYVSANIHFPSGGSALLYGLIQTSYSSQPGDSGGIVYSNDNSILGIHEGADASYTYSIDASNINSTFSLSLY